MAWIKTRKPRETIKLKKDPPTTEFQEDAAEAIHRALDEMIGQDETVEVAKDLLAEHSAAILKAAGLSEDSAPYGFARSSEEFDEDRVPTAKVRYLDEISSGNVPTPEPDDLVGEIAEQVTDGGLFDSVFGESLDQTTDASDPPTSEVLLQEAEAELSPPKLDSLDQPDAFEDSFEAIPQPVESVDQENRASANDSVEVPAEQSTVWSFEEEAPPAVRPRPATWRTWLVRGAGLAVVGVGGWTFAAGLPLWLTITVVAAGLVIAVAGPG